MLAELPPPGDVRIGQANNPNFERLSNLIHPHQALAACCVKLPIRPPSAAMIPQQRIQQAFAVQYFPTGSD